MKQIRRPCHRAVAKSVDKAYRHCEEAVLPTKQSHPRQGEIASAKNRPRNDTPRRLCSSPSPVIDGLPRSDYN